MSERVIVRRATEADIEFLIDTIFIAEMSGSGKLGYTSVFAMSEEDVRDLFRKLLREDLVGQELCISGFMVAEVDGVVAGALCGWVEGEGGLPSRIIKANLLHFHLSPEALESANSYAEELAKLPYGRIKGALQLESGYVKPEFRGRKIFAKLMRAHVDALEEGQRNCTMQLIPDGANIGVIDYYKRLGFSFVREECADSQVLRDIFPSDRRVYLEYHPASEFTVD